MGIEPTQLAWKARTLPLSYTRTFYYYEIEMVGAAGFEPATPWSQARCATKLRYAPLTQELLYHIRCFNVNTFFNIFFQVSGQSAYSGHS